MPWPQDTYSYRDYTPEQRTVLKSIYEQAWNQGYAFESIMLTSNERARNTHRGNMHRAEGQLRDQFKKAEQLGILTEANERAKAGEQAGTRAANEEKGVRTTVERGLPPVNAPGGDLRGYTREQKAALGDVSKYAFEAGKESVYASQARTSDASLEHEKKMSAAFAKATTARERATELGVGEEAAARSQKRAQEGIRAAEADVRERDAKNMPDVDNHPPRNRPERGERGDGDRRGGGKRGGRPGLKPKRRADLEDAIDTETLTTFASLQTGEGNVGSGVDQKTISESQSKKPARNV